MATPVLLPKQGQSVESCIITAWKKQVGETVSAGETLAEVETDKALLEVESPVEGTLLAQFFSQGDDVPVLTTIAAVGEPGEEVDDLRPEQAAPAPAEPAPAESPAPAGPPSPEPVSSQVEAAGEKADDRLKISPRAKNLAERKEIEVEDLAGSGPGGRIIERDVEAAIAEKPRLTPLAKSMLAQGDFEVPRRGSGVGGRVRAEDLTARPAPETAPAAPKEAERIPLKGVRRVIAERMLESVQSTAQLTLNATADARALLAYRKKLKASAEGLGLQQVSINDLLLFAVSRVLLDYPALNAHLTEEAILRYPHVHLGFAVDTPRGLMVPVIGRADELSLKQLSKESNRLATACQEGKISPDELQGGTFTVTNLGSLGIEFLTPILNPPEVAILGVGNINLKPVQGEEEVEFIPHLGLSLTINHQAVDGAPAARFMQALTQALAQIDLLLAL